MTLSWYGLSSFKITNIGNETTIITDPFTKESGLVPPRGAANVVLISKDEGQFNNVAGITGTPLIVRNPGEFDLKGVYIRAIKNNSNPFTTIFHLEMDGVKIAFLGVFNARELNENQLEELNGVDVLIIPIGGKEKVCSWEWASHIVQQTEPKYVIPCFYKQPGLKIDVEDPEKFIKEMGGDAQKEDRLTLKTKDLNIDVIKVVLLNPQR